MRMCLLSTKSFESGLDPENQRPRSSQLDEGLVSRRCPSGQSVRESWRVGQRVRRGRSVRLVIGCVTASAAAGHVQLPSDDHSIDAQDVIRPARGTLGRIDGPFSAIAPHRLGIQASNINVDNKNEMSDRYIFAVLG